MIKHLYQLFLSLCLIGIGQAVQAQELQQLQPNKPVEREISGKQEHSYQIQLAANQFMRVYAEQKNINITLVLVDPEGKQLIETNLTSFFAQESLSREAATGGLHLLKVSAANPAAPPGTYRLKLEVRTAATAADKLRINAEQALVEAKPLAAKGGAESQQAVEKYEKALQQWREIGDRYWEAQTLASLGRAFSRMSRMDQALKYHKEALQISRETSDKAGEADVLNSLGGVYYNTGRFEEAVNHFQQMLAIKRELKDRDGEGGALLNIGAVYNTWGYQDKSIEHYGQALQIMREVKNRRSEAFALTGLGNVHSALNQYDKSIEYSQQSLKIYRELKERLTEGLTLNNLGQVHNSIGRYEEAIKYFEQALNIAREVNDRRGVGNALSGLGQANFYMSRYAKATEYSEQALQINREVKNKIGEKNALNHLGMYASSQGQYDQAISYFEQSAAISREVKDREGEGGALANLGIVYNYLGRHDKAIEFLERSLALDREFKDKSGESKTLNNLGLVYAGLGNHNKAAEHYEKALQIIREVKNRGSEPAALSNLGSVYFSLKKYEAAGEYFKQALVVSREVKDKVVEGRTISGLASVNYALGRYDEMVEQSKQALAILREVKDSTSEAKSLHSLAKVELERGNLNNAREYIEECIKIVERLRSNIYNQESRASYFASVQEYYKLYIDVLMRLHQSDSTKGFDALAVEASEKSSSRGLLELLTEAGAQIRQGVDLTLLEREQTLARQLNEKAARQITLLGQSPSLEQTASLRKEINQLETDYEQVQATIRRTSPRYAALVQPQPLSLAEIQQTLDPETLLLKYSLGAQRSYLWAISDSSVTNHELPNRDEVEKSARRLYELLTVRSRPQNNETAAQKRQRVQQAEAELLQSAQQLSKMILEPAADRLGKKRVVIVADGALQYVPFAMLPVPEKKANPAKTGKQTYRPLIVDHEIVSLPSASALAVQRQELVNRKPAPQALAVIADPVFETNDVRVIPIKNQAASKVEQPTAEATNTRQLVHTSETKFAISRLPFTRQEADQILTAVPASASLKATDFKANRAAVLSGELSNYRYLHFATHGYLDTERPGLSALVLSMIDEQGQPQDGFLRAHEIYNLNLPAELVVLSACQTGLGKEIKGEGLIGLTRGFMYAGAKRVVVSLWSVNDKATSDLMTKFYQGMLKDNQRPAAALRTAQIEMWKQKQWQSPYYWSAFVIQGEWK
jgi:CHAT domain-containing protein/tetratricopeptide (TPR) repeat protein